MKAFHGPHRPSDEHDRSKRLAAIAALMLLILGVRLYYYTGPVFANTQDEGIYLTTFAMHTVFSNPLGFSQYRGADFGSTTNGLFNPAQIFQFYVGFEYPILFLMKLLGYSAALAIGYVMFTSLIEGLFLFLIIERLAGIRAGLLGGILFAFTPVDVLFATHVQPLVPAMMAVTIAVYLFIRAAGGATAGKARLLLLSGFFIGIAYITNPVGLLPGIFLGAAAITMPVWAREGHSARAMGALALLAGFIIAYSLIGAVYLAEAGNFLLFPMADHSMFAYEMANQPLARYCVTGSLCLQWAVGSPTFYLRLLANMKVFSNPYLTYFGYSFFAFVALSLAYLLYFRRRAAARKALFFMLMFLFYLLALSYLPVLASNSGGTITLSMIDEQPYLSTLLVLPMTVVLALVMESAIVAFRGRRPALFAVSAIILLLVAESVMVLNSDAGVYRASASTLRAFTAYVAANPDTSFYAEWQFSNAANLLTAYRYSIRQSGCSKAVIAALPPGSDIVTGGTISMDISPDLIESYDSCALGNMSGYSSVFYIRNALANYSGARWAPPLVIYTKR